MTDDRPPTHHRRSRFPWLAALLLIAAGIAAGWYFAGKPPSPAALVRRAQAAREKINSVSFSLTSPWPQAQSPASGLPGARTLLGGVEGDRSWHVLWRKDGSMRAELVEPADAAGALTIVTPESTWVWSPLLKVGISAGSAGPVQLWVDEVLAIATASVEQAGPVAVVGGRFVVDFPVHNPVSGNLRVGFDRKSQLPLTADLLDANGRLLSSLAVSSVDLSPSVGDDDFAFVPPDGTRVLDMGQPQSFPDVAAATAGVPFTPLEPAYLPAGFQLTAVNLFGRGEGASLVLTYRRPGDAAGPAGGLISLTQAKAGGDYRPLPYGTPASVGNSEGRSFELGELRGLDWRAGSNALTLFGTVSASELTRVAASLR